MNILNRLKWSWKTFWGAKYYVRYTDKLKSDEILVYGHKIYIGKEYEYGSKKRYNFR